MGYKTFSDLKQLIMKRILLMFLMIFCKIVMVSAQSNYFLDTTNQWLMEYHGIDGTFREVHYFKLWSVYDTTAVYNNLEYSVIGNHSGAIYCLREDTTTGITYIKKCDTLSEELVYMRNDLQIGDTILHYGFLSEDGYDTLFLETTAVGYDTFTNKISNMLDSVKSYKFQMHSSIYDDIYYYHQPPSFSYLRGFDTGPIIQSYFIFENSIWRTYCFWNQYYGSRKCSDIPTGVKEPGMSSISVYPNPASHTINIAGNIANSEITVFNSVGQIVLNRKYDSQVDISMLPPGIYLLQVSNEGLVSGITKFQKIR